jgi:hypothetical protein
VALRYEPSFRFLLIQARRELFECFSGNELPAWQGKSFPQDPDALYRDLEHLQKHPLNSEQLYAIARAQTLLLLLHRQLWTLLPVSKLLGLIEIGLRATAGGQRAHEENKVQLKHRNEELNRRAADMLERHPDRTASAIAKSPTGSRVKDDFKKLNLLPPPSLQTIRKIIGPTVNSYRQRRALVS